MLNRTGDNKYSSSRLEEARGGLRCLATPLRVVFHLCPNMSQTAIESRRRKHLLTEKMKVLSAKALAQRVGYLRVGDPADAFFDTLPRLSYNAGRQIKSRDNLYLVKSGSVIIRHARYEYFVKDLSPGVLFGNMPLLGQTMLVTEALAGSQGVTLAVMDKQGARRWIESNPIGVVEKIGPQLCLIEFEHYRSRFQLSDSRLAALILELSGEGSTVEGFSHEDLGHMLGMYRETVTMGLAVMEEDKLIEVGRMKITVLDRRALQKLTEL